MLLMVPSFDSKLVLVIVRLCALCSKRDLVCTQVISSNGDRASGLLLHRLTKRPSSPSTGRVSTSVSASSFLSFCLTHCFGFESVNHVISLKGTAGSASVRPARQRLLHSQCLGLLMEPTTFTVLGCSK